MTTFYERIRGPDGAALLLAYGELLFDGQYERDIEEGLMIILDYWGQEPQRQVPSLVGIADIVTKTAIYEIKYLLNRQTIFHALGQVLLYRACLCPDATPILVGHILEDITPFRKVLDRMGVQVQCWPHDFGLD